MNSFVDQYDRRIFRNGQVMGVNYGGSVHQPTITYSTIPNLGAGRLPDPGPRYGESRPPVIFDNTENPSSRSPRYSGGDPNLGNTAGMFNLPYYGGFMNPTPMPYYEGQDYGGVELLAGGFNHPINEGAKNRKIRNIRNLKEGTSGPEKDAAEQMLKRLGGPQLPLAQGLPMGFQNKYVS